MMYQNGLSRPSHPEVGRFYWTRNNTVAHFVGYDFCPVFYIPSERPGVEEDEPIYLSDHCCALRGFNAVFTEYTDVPWYRTKIAHNYDGCAYGVGFDIMDELTEEEIAYFVTQVE